jgi:small subunit ribosomal protein S8
MIKKSIKSIPDDGNDFEKKTITERVKKRASVIQKPAIDTFLKPKTKKIKSKQNHIYPKQTYPKQTDSKSQSLPLALEKPKRPKPLKQLQKQENNSIHSMPTLSINAKQKTKQTSQTNQVVKATAKTKSKTKPKKITNPTHKSKPLISKVNDTLSDMLTRIRNAQQAKHNTVKVIHTKRNLKIIRLLKNEGFIKQALRSRPSVNKPYIMIYLKYLTADKIPCISKLQRVSSPGLRHYVAYKDLPKVLNGMGVSVLTTAKGIMSDKQARREKVGGELLFEIY